MSDNTDFDVDNYSMEDLIHILKIQNEAPLSKMRIIQAVEEMVEKFEGQEKYVDFFLNVQSKLLEEKDLYTQPLVKKKAAKDLEEINEMHDLIKKTHPDTIIQTPGEINGVNSNKLTEITGLINFDSLDRPMLDPIPLVDCSGLKLSTQQSKLTQNASDYQFNISKPLKNVTKIKLIDLVIPMTWHVFSGDYGTNYIDISSNETHQIIKIDDGNYTEDELISRLNTETNISFAHDGNNGKISVTNNTGSTIEINWYYPKNTEDCGYAQGQKLDYNLGWLLGFRDRSNIVLHGKKLTATGILNLKGFDYLFISLDDFVNNKPNPDLVTNMQQKDQYKLPSYYNRYTMDIECDNLPKPTFPTNCLPEQSSCANVPINVDKSGLTKNQLYGAEQIKSAISSLGVDRYGAPVVSDLLAKVLVNFEFRNQIILQGSAFNFKGNRDYFGPVTLRKFKVSLLSKFGHVINLNKMDWSFTIQYTTTY
jgi:hypothetical protein